MSKSFRRILLVVIVLAAFCVALWYFTDIFVYMFVALILSIIGGPLVKLLRRVKIGRFTMPDSLAAGITLLVIVAVLGAFFMLLAPFVTYEIRQIQSIDFSVIVGNFSNLCTNVDLWLHERNLLSADISLNNIMIDKVTEFVSSFHITSFFGDVAGALAGLFIFLFSVFFMTYFSLKDNTVFWSMIKKWIPVSLRDNFDHILAETKKQLRRYFTGVFMEMGIVGVLDGLFCFLFGVPNALLIGLAAGILNIIPYVGPLIAGALAIGIGLSSTFVMGTGAITALIIKIVAIFIGVKMIDDFVLQPNIYGKSVNAHPLEIFIVILVAGKVAGVWGMMFGVPAYTLIRIVVHEFFSSYYASNLTPYDTPDSTANTSAGKE